MKQPLSKTLTEENIAFSYPLEIKDADGNRTYAETSDGYWYRHEYDADGRYTYFENSNGYWYRYEYDANGNRTYYENSNGKKLGTPKAKHKGKVVTVDGIDYELKEITKDENTTK